MQSHSQSVLLNETQAAHQLGLKVTTMRRWRWSGDGPTFIKIGAAVRYDPIDLQKFIEAGRRSSTSDHRTGASPE
jgi:Helix-turn-helix domain